MPQVLFAGLATIDIQYFTDRLPGPNEKLKSAPPTLLCGGPALNAAVSFAFLNESAVLLSAIGKNPFTNFIVQDLNFHGVTAVDFMEDEQVDIPLATVITNAKGERSILSHHPEDHAYKLNPAVLLKEKNVSCVMIDGFYPKMSLNLCKAAREAGAEVILDGGSWKDNLNDLLAYVDIAICSADFLPPGCKTENEVFQFLKERGVPKVAVSRGDLPILYCEGHEIKEIPVTVEPVIDTLGAGDFLHGAFCYYYQETKNFEIALGKASQFASATCRYRGTRECFIHLDKARFRVNKFHNLYHH